MSQDDSKVPVDAIKKHYMDIRDRMMGEQDIKETFSRDVIQRIFLKGLRQKLRKKECISILTKAQTTKGKSTLAQFLMMLINGMIVDLKMETTYKGETETPQLIAPNQIEFTRIARRSDLFNVCAIIDEYSHLGQTGAQATIEENLFKWRTNVCAQKFIHTVMCTPTSEFDENAIIILEIIDKDEENKTILCKLFYNDPTALSPVYLGNILFDISSVLKKEWHKMYRIKKFFAIELAEREMIRDVRELEESLIVLMTYMKCKDLAEMGYSDKNLTKCKVRDSAREVGAVYSIVGEEIVYKWAQSLLDLVAKRFIIRKELNKPRKEPLSPRDQQEMIKQIAVYDEHIEKELQKYNKLTELYIRYMSIGDNQIGKLVIEICKKNNISVKEIDTKEDILRLAEKYKLEKPKEAE